MGWTKYWKHISNEVVYSSPKYRQQMYNRNIYNKTVLTHIHNYHLFQGFYIALLYILSISDADWQETELEPNCCTFCFTCKNKQLSHHRGKVLFLSRPIRLRLMVVEQGTASRWWELLGSVGTHWLLLFAFCSLYRKDKKHNEKGTQAIKYCASIKLGDSQVTD